jgi:cob(I)alamin adenosyltransferase
MRLTKIYTKVGDKGTTLLASGAKVRKDSPRIDCYGTVDELNSFVGLLRDTLAETRDLFADLIEQLAAIQNECFDLGGELATPIEILDPTRQQVVSHAAIERLEAPMDAYNESLKPLENFILPGGHRANSLAHVCRTVCRRAERGIVALANSGETVRDEPRIYLNRLSDWLFVASRVISQRLGVPELLWQQAKKK